MVRYYEEGRGRVIVYILDVVYSFNIGSLDRRRVSNVEVNAEARTDGASQDYIVGLYIFNYKTSMWQQAGSFPGSTNDVNLSWLSGLINPVDYIDAGGNLKLMWGFVSEDFSRLGIDFQSIELTMRQWTFVVYQDGDMHIGFDPGEVWAALDLNEMEMIGSTPDVSVVVQMDAFYGTAKRYFVMQDNDVETVNSPVIQDLGEVNMGRNDTLTDFVEWAINGYSAANYCLVLWDHGNGFQYLCVDETSNYDYLDMAELKYALNKITLDTGRIIDVIDFDACLMQMIEVAYQIRDYGKVMVASEETMMAEGLPYQTVLGNLTAEPDMTPGQLGEKMVDAYEDYWTPPRYITYEEGYRWSEDRPITKLTLSAINLTALQGVVVWLDDFAIRLYNDLSDPVMKAAINQCRVNAQEYMTDISSNHWYYVDLYNFTKQVYDHPDINNETKDRAYHLMQALNDTVIHEWHDLGAWLYHYDYLRVPPWIIVTQYWVVGCPGSHGTSIFFPDDPNDYENLRDQYEALDFSTAHFAWPYFLKEFLEIPL
jgi:hypothetical protein